MTDSPPAHRPETAPGAAGARRGERTDVPSARLTGSLADRLVTLAGTPDDSAQIGTDLIVVAQLAAARLAAVDAASVTSRFDGAYATVAASSDLAVAVDKAQYADRAGPCLQALETGCPVAVADISTATAWPGFHGTARRARLRASLSVPLFAGSGRGVAVLNLYSRRPAAMAALSAAVCDAYGAEAARDWDHDHLDEGGRELTAGVIGALALRRMIQEAIRTLASTTADSAGAAYHQLCTRAAESGTSLVDTAAQLIERHRTGR